MIELQDIFKKFGEQYISSHNIHLDGLKAINSITQCRTVALGGHAASQTLVNLALDKKYLGAKIGVTMVLHTWGQTLSFHPHVHCIVPGGGLSPSGITFIKSKKFFIPVKVLSKVFKGKFLDFVIKSLDSKELKLPSNFSKTQFDTLKNELYSIDWVVLKKAF